MLARLKAIQPMRGYVTVLGAILMHLTLGTMYTYANMSTYLVSYLHHYNPSIGFQSAAWIYSSGVTGTSAFMWTGGYLERWIGSRWTILVGGLLYSVPIFLTSFACKSFFWTLVLYGLVPGIGTGIAYGATISCGVRWFPAHSGLVSGVILSGYGLGTLIFNPVVTQLVNPHNKKIPAGQTYYPIEDLDHLPYALMILGVCYAIMQVLSVMMISLPTTEDDRKREETSLLKAEAAESGSAPSETPVSPAPPKVREEDGLEPMEAIRTKQFLLIWIMCGINSLSMTTMSSFWKELGLVNVTSNDLLLSVIGSVSSIANAVGRIFWGAINDRFQFKTTIVTNFFLLAAMIASISFIRPVGGFTVYVCLVYFLNGGNYPLFPSVVSCAFGRKRFQVIYGFVVTAQIITSNLASLLANALLDKMGLESIFCVVSLFLLTGALVTLTFYTPLNWQERKAAAQAIDLPPPTETAVLLSMTAPQSS